MRSLPRAYAQTLATCTLIACALVAVVLPANAGAASSVRIVRDVPVPTSDGARITVDVWQVPTRTKRARGGATRGPALRKVALLVHGGGWHSGDKRQWEQSRWAQRLVKNGWLVVNANYRLACTARVPRAEHEPRDSRLCGHAMRDSIADVKSALRFTSKKARSWGGDPSRIVLFGASAGGQLAMLAGSDRGRPSGVRAVVAIGPPTNLTWVGQRPEIALYASARQSIGCALGECPEAWRAASPISAVRAGITPPTWIFNARQDPITSIVPIRAYLTQLERRGIPAQLATPVDPNAECHGPIPCGSEALEGGPGDMFEHAINWLRAYA